MKIFGSSFAFVPGPMAEVRGTGGMVSQAEEGMKLFEAQQGTAAEVDKAGAEKYKNEVESRNSPSVFES